MWKKHSVQELVSEFGIPGDVAQSLLTHHDSLEIDLPRMLSECENEEASVFGEEVLNEFTDSLGEELPLKRTREYSDEEIERMIDELKHAFD